MFNKIKRYIEDPYFAFGHYLINKSPHLMPDKYYLSVLFRILMGYDIDWREPKSFNEKLNWLKLYDRNPFYTSLVDKYRVKQWITDTIGEQFVIPTLAAYDSVDDIDLNELPDQFVLKCNHDSGSVFICRDKSSFDLESAKQILSSALNKNFYWEAREWPYKNVKRTVFAEKYLGENLQDYRIYCFNGCPKLVYSYTNKSVYEGTKPEPVYCDIFDCEWNALPFHQKSLPKGGLNPPKQLAEMIELAKVLSRNIAFVRVDLYQYNNKPVIGEMTLFPGGGLSEFYPKEWDSIIWGWLEIPTKR